MALQINWSHRSKQDLISILTYLEKNWTSQVIEKFLDKVEKKLFLLSEMPYMCRVSLVRKNVRRCVLTKQIVLYYRVKENEIELITFFDAHQDPEKLKEILED